LPQAFLAADACLKLALNLASGLTVNRAVIRRGVEEQLPFMATENLIMAAVAKGGDRQKAHEAIRKHSHAVTAGIKEGSTTSRELTDRLKNDPMFSGIDIGRELDPARYVGRSPEQVDEFIEQEVRPVRQRYGAHLGQMGDVAVLNAPSGLISTFGKPRRGGFAERSESRGCPMALERVADRPT